MLSRLTGWSKAEVEDLEWDHFLECCDEAIAVENELRRVE